MAGLKNPIGDPHSWVITQGELMKKMSVHDCAGKHHLKNKLMNASSTEG